MRGAGDPKKTREAILRAAFERMHRNGFQAAGLADILNATGLTKGAFYHHFPTKLALGYAIVDELVADYLETWWLAPLEEQDDPIEALARIIRDRLVKDIPDMIHLGCPLANLMTEMSPVDEGFRERLEGLYRHWRKGLARALRRGQQRGTVRGDADAEEAAAFIIAALQGAFAQAKVAQSMQAFRDCMEGLAAYLTMLRRQ